MNYQHCTELASIVITIIATFHIIKYAYEHVHEHDSSQTNSSLEFWIINLRLGLGVLGFWVWDEFWG